MNLMKPIHRYGNTFRTLGRSLILFTLLLGILIPESFAQKQHWMIYQGANSPGGPYQDGLMLNFSGGVPSSTSNWVSNSSTINRFYFGSMESPSGDLSSLIGIDGLSSRFFDDLSSNPPVPNSSYSPGANSGNSEIGIVPVGDDDGNFYVIYSEKTGANSRELGYATYRGPNTSTSNGLINNSMTDWLDKLAISPIIEGCPDYRFMYAVNYREIHRYKIDKNGIYYDGILPNGPNHIPANFSTFGPGLVSEFELSHDGSKLAIGVSKVTTNPAFCETVTNFYVFDAVTGLILSQHQTNDWCSITGLEFSPDGNTLYLSGDPSFLIPGVYSMDITLPNPPINHISNSYSFRYSDLELGVDGKIYAVGSSSMGAISNPNTPLTPGFNPNAYTLPSGAIPSTSIGVGESVKLPDQVDGELATDWYDTDQNICVADIHLDNESASTIGGTSFNGQTITVEGTLTIDQDFSIFNSDIYMRPGARIEILGGARLRMINTNIDACRDMWDGLYLTSSTSELICYSTTSNHQFMNSEHGVVSENGAKFTIYRMDFVDNYRHLQVRNWTGVHPGSISICNFSSGPIDRCPRIGEKTLHAIEVINGGEFTIGEGTTAAYENDISEAYNGVFVQNAHVIMKNNRIHHTNVGVRAYDLSGPDTRLVTEAPNTLTENGYGIVNYGVSGHGVEADIKGCSISNSTYMGIYLVNNDGTNDMEVHGNAFVDNPQSIYAGNNPSSILHIHGNSINNSVSTYDGITVYDVASPGGVDLEIFNNTPIRNTQNGIFLYNVYDPLVTGNQIFTSVTPSTQRKGGIYCNYVNEGHISDNYVGRVGFSGFTTRIGIGASNCRNTMVVDNVLNYQDYALWIGGVSPGTETHCNTIDRCQVGLLANWTTLSVQGSATNPVDNRWNTVSNWDTYCYNSNGEANNYFVNISGSTTVPAFVPTLNGSSSGFLPITPDDAPYPENCSSFLRKAGGDLTSLTSMKLFQGEDYPVERRWNAHQQVYKWLLETPALLEGNKELQEFAASYENKPLADLSKAEIAAANQDWELVRTILDRVLPKAQVEVDLKTVLEIYANTFSPEHDDVNVIGLFRLTDQDKIQVKKIADKSILEGGKSVALARTLLDLTRWEAPIEYAYSDGDVEVPPAPARPNTKYVDVMGEQIGNSYPVPALDKVFIPYETETRYEVSLIDLNGLTLRQIQIEPGQGIMQISLEGIAGGIYFLKGKNTLGQTFVRKIVVGE